MYVNVSFSGPWIVGSRGPVVNLVSFGVGVSIVPHRVLALHPQSRPVQRITTNPKFSRELLVAVRRDRESSVPLRDFITNILF
jgi:DNA-binding transcriptional LysR family regulator